MSFYVYILKCGDGEYYTGFTHNLRKRIVEHQNGENISTQYRRPIKLKYFCGFYKEEVAVKFEKYLKSHSGREFRDKHLI